MAFIVKNVSIYCTVDVRGWGTAMCPTMLSFLHLILVAFLVARPDQK